MDPVLLAKLGRALLNTLGTALVTRGVLTASQESAAETALVTIVGAVPLLYSIGMIVYRHFVPTPAMVSQVVNAAAPTNPPAAP